MTYHTPVTHYEILTERLKDARIDRLEEVISEKFNTVYERINSTNERINSTNERIDSVKTELLTEIKSTNTRIDATNQRIDGVKTELLTEIKNTNSKLNLVLVFMGIGFSALFAFMSFALQNAIK